MPAEVLWRRLIVLALVSAAVPMIIVIASGRPPKFIIAGAVVLTVGLGAHLPFDFLVVRAQQRRRMAKAGGQVAAADGRTEGLASGQATQRSMRQHVGRSNGSSTAITTDSPSAGSLGWRVAKAAARDLAIVVVGVPLVILVFAVIIRVALAVSGNH